jgi:hypothetical protein
MRDVGPPTTVRAHLSQHLGYEPLPCSEGCGLNQQRPAMRRTDRSPTPLPSPEGCGRVCTFPTEE